MHRSNILLLVGGPPSPLYAPNKVILYSLDLGAAVASLEFSSPVLGLAARVDRLAVVLLHKVVLFALPRGPQAVYREGAYETAENPKGLIAMASLPHTTLLTFPGRQAGHVCFVRLPPLQADSPPPHEAGKAKDPPFPATHIVLAHTTSLSGLSCTPDGKLVVTSSIKGTLIRLWDARSATLLRELRRGTDSADIFSLAIHPQGAAVAAASDKGTVHIWNFSAELEGEQDAENDPAARPYSRRPPQRAPSEGVALLKPYLPKYFSSTWSDAQFRLPPPAPAQPRGLPFLDALSEEKREKAITVEDDQVVVAWVEDPTLSKGRSHCLLAITQSGGWFKLGMLRESEGKRVRDEQLGYGAEGRCELLAFRHFGRDW